MPLKRPAAAATRATASPTALEPNTMPRKRPAASAQGLPAKTRKGDGEKAFAEELEIPIVNALREISFAICGGTYHPKSNQRVHDAPGIAPGKLGRLAVVPLEQLTGRSLPNEADMKHWVQVRAAFPGYQRPAHVGSDDYWEEGEHGVLEGDQDEADYCIRQPIDGNVSLHACVFQGMVWRHPEHGLAFDGIESYYNGMDGHCEDAAISLTACEGTTARRLRRFSETYGIELSVGFATVESRGRKTWALVVSQDNAMS